MSLGMMILQATNHIFSDLVYFYSRDFGTLWFGEQLLNSYGLNYNNKKVAEYTLITHMQ